MSSGAGAALAACQAFTAAAPVQGAAFTVMDSDLARETLCASDAVIAKIAALQFSLGEGPALDVFTTRRPVLIPDLAAPRAALRWPVFIAEAAQLPVGGLFTFPMHLGAITVGVCEVYRREPGPLNVPDLKTVLRALDAVTLTLLSQRAAQPLDGLSDGAAHDGIAPARLDGHGANRQQVHQATGMLIAQLGVSAEEAFARLRAHAYANGKDVDEVGADIIARRLRLEPDPK